MDYKDKFILQIFIFFLLVFSVITFESGYTIILDGFSTYLFIKFIICTLLILITIHFFVKFVRKSKNKDYIYLILKGCIIMLVGASVATFVVILTKNSLMIFLALIILAIIITLFLFIEVRKKELYVQQSKVYCSYKYVNVFWSKNQTENVKVGDKLNGPFFRSKKLWKLKTRKGKIIGYVYRPDIMDDLKRRKIQGVNSFTVSKIDSEGNVYVDIDVYISKSRLLNGSASYDDSLEKTSFILDTNEQPAKNITITRLILESERRIESKCTLQSEELFLGRCFENVKIVDADYYNADVFNNEILEFCYDEDGSILLLSNFNVSPVGHINDISVKNLIKSFDNYENLIRISIQKIENNRQTGKKDIYVRVLLYK